MTYTINPNFALNSHENVKIKGNTSLNNQFVPIGQPKTLTMRSEFSWVVDDDRNGGGGEGIVLWQNFCLIKLILH